LFSSHLAFIMHRSHCPSRMRKPTYQVGLISPAFKSWLIFSIINIVCKYLCKCECVSVSLLLRWLCDISTCLPVRCSSSLFPLPCCTPFCCRLSHSTSPAEAPGQEHTINTSSVEWRSCCCHNALEAVKDFM